MSGKKGCWRFAEALLAEGIEGLSTAAGRVDGFFPSFRSANPA
jgi:hypothetical protein